jgi:hypothetical protein
VDFVAGWANAGAVPKGVRVAVRQLAAHWYENREAFTERKLGDLAAGWGHLTRAYGLGLQGDWGQ